MSNTVALAPITARATALRPSEPQTLAIIYPKYQKNIQHDSAKIFQVKQEYPMQRLQDFLEIESSTRILCVPKLTYFVQHYS